MSLMRRYRTAAENTVAPLGLRVGQTIGSLGILRFNRDGSADCMCECGQFVRRRAHSLYTALKRGDHSSCGPCAMLRRKGVYVGRSARRLRRLYDAMTDEQKARVARVVRGRKELEVWTDAVELVLRNLDDLAAETPRPDPFKCCFKARYSEPL